MEIRNSPTVVGLGNQIDLVREVNLADQGASAETTAHFGIIVDNLSTILLLEKDLAGSLLSDTDTLFHGEVVNVP